MSSFSIALSVSLAATWAREAPAGGSVRTRANVEVKLKYITLGAFQGKW